MIKIYHVYFMSGFGSAFMSGVANADNLNGFLQIFLIGISLIGIGLGIRAVRRECHDTTA
jgi:mannose/fructose/N-acetylgalactosamine-specific phosphotransferase system component IIC